MPDVTTLLQLINDGDAKAAGALLPLVYSELRRLAKQKLACESPGQTLDATALVRSIQTPCLDAINHEAGLSGSRGAFPFPLNNLGDVDPVLIRVGATLQLAVEQSLPGVRPDRVE